MKIFEYFYKFLWTYYVYDTKNFEILLLDYHDYIGNICNKLKNTYRSYKIFISSIQFTEIAISYKNILYYTRIIMNI